jgi:cytochrome c peroxidase
MAAKLEPIQELGKFIFFDNISVPKRMSCSTCHDPMAGWTFKNSGVNLHQVAVTGADPHTAGSLKPPSNAYASFILPFQNCGAAPTGWCGGNFWNGRAEGNDLIQFPGGATEHIGLNDPIFVGGGNVFDEYKQYLGPVADQALNPFGNPVEQNIEREGVCRHVASTKYAELFEIVWGEPINCSNGGEIDKSFKRIAVSLAAYQASDEVNSFSSKRDIVLRNEADGKFPLGGFTAQENRGHDLFYATFFRPLPDGKFANCALCHNDNPTNDGTEPKQLYSDDSYHNIGTPRNFELPGSPEPNKGLAGHTGDPAHTGEFKTPTLRNVDKRPGVGFTKAYTHNGWFKSLESIVHFYNTAAVKVRCPEDVTTEKEALAQNCWSAPEHPSTVPPAFIIGNLRLTPEDEAAIVAYLKTFTDTETPKPPQPYKPAKN